jgi:hypothetical protein
MRMSYKRVSIQVFLLSTIISLSSCHKDDVSVEEEKAPLVNSFAMELNGKAWQPGQIGKDECMRTYNGAWSSIGENPFYNITAYWDPKGVADHSSENILRLQIMNLRSLGEYKPRDSYIDPFKSYALFSVKKPDGSSIRYINKGNVASFSVVFQEFITLPNTSIQGVKGTFYGTLYNEVNPLDSITITRGTFTLKKTNWYNFDQCD